VKKLHVDRYSLVLKIQRGEKLTEDEKSFLLNLVMPPRSGDDMTADEMYAVAVAYAVLHALDPDRQHKDIRGEVCDAYQVSEGTVFNARRQYESWLHPEGVEKMLWLVLLMTGGDEDVVHKDLRLIVSVFQRPEITLT
jgi:single-stranded DNA-specific DHH superfamily exonuclease